MSQKWQSYGNSNTDEARKPLQAYREEELHEMWLNFFGADPSYHLARKRFVYKGLMPMQSSIRYPRAPALTP